MARYTAWKTVIDGTEKKHRSENATYSFLRTWAAGQPDDTRATVYVQEPGSERWHTFERHRVVSGLLDEVLGFDQDGA